MNPAADVHSVLVGWLKHRLTSREDQRPSSPSDWERFIQELRDHALLPLFSSDVELGRMPAVPPSVRDTLRREAVAIAARNLVLVSESQAVLREALSRGIGCVLVRGVALSEQLHGNPALRPTGDIDLLVRPETLNQVRKIFRKRGFVEVEPRVGYATRFYYALEFFKEGPFLIIAEPRWSLAYPPFVNRIPMDSVWGRMRRAKVLGCSTQQLAPEDLLIHLSLHLLHHGTAAPLLWSYELARLIQTETLDWTLIERVGGEANLSVLAGAALRRVQAHLPVRVPAEVMARLNNVRGPWLERRILAILSSPRPVRGRERLATLLSLHGIGAKLRYLLALFFPSAAYVRAQYGVRSQSQLIVTYATRIGRWSWRGLKGVIRLLAVPVSGTGVEPGARSGRASARRRGLLLRTSAGDLWGKLTHPLAWPVDLGPPGMLLERTVAHYDRPEEVAWASKQVARGLTDEERALVNGPMARRGRVLDVGCGAGREAIALARLGYDVVGIDAAHRMIDVARANAARYGVQATFLPLSVHEVTPALGRFDYVLANRGFYSLIPSSRLRGAALAAMGQVLHPAGALFVGAYAPAVYRPGLRAMLVDWLRRCTPYASDGCRTTEPGDRLEGQSSPVSDPAEPIFVHVFRRPQEIEAEIRRAGLRSVRITDELWQVRRGQAGLVGSALSRSA